MLFLSDVHLGAFSEEKNQKLENDLIRLVDFCEQNKLDIIVLGDFFDYWLEYRGKPPPVGQAVLHRFEEFHKNNSSHTLYITGNHDNWTGEYLNRVGFDVEHEYRIIKVNDYSVMVMHGDGLRDPAMNLQRPLMHRFLRNSYFTACYRTLIPPWSGWRIMKLFSASSKKLGNTKKSYNRGEILDAWARDKVQNDESIQAIVYGHHHRPVLWQEKDKTCMNCGCFGTDNIVGLYTNGNFKIVIWDADNKTMSDHQRIQTA